MPKYLILASISQEALKGTFEEGGTAREAAVRAAVASVGGTLDAFYYAFGDSDIVAIADMPNNAAMAGFSAFIALSGVGRISTTPLLTPAEIDEAVKLHPDYRPPGHVSSV